MKTLTSLPGLVVLAVAIAAGRPVEAQGYSVQDGYGLGLGIGYGSAYGAPGGRCGGHLNGFAPFGGVIMSPPREDLPYFAKFPPVYYSGIVARPYGISPYAAPPGIVPVEMTVAPPPQPALIKNPFYVPVSDDGVENGAATEEASGRESQEHPTGPRAKKGPATSAQRIVNPFYAVPELAAD